MKNNIISIEEHLPRKRSDRKIVGHEHMDIARFIESVQHMIVFDVLKEECPVGARGEQVRLYLSDIGYKAALKAQARMEMKIIAHALVEHGEIYLVFEEKGAIIHAKE